MAWITGLLLSSRFTSQLPSESDTISAGDDVCGRYNMLSLDGFLIDPITKFKDIHLGGWFNGDRHGPGMDLDLTVRYIIDVEQT